MMSELSNFTAEDRGIFQTSFEEFENNFTMYNEFKGKFQGEFLFDKIKHDNSAEYLVCREFFNSNIDTKKINSKEYAKTYADYYFSLFLNMISKMVNKHGVKPLCLIYMFEYVNGLEIWNKLNKTNVTMTELYDGFLESIELVISNQIVLKPITDKHIEDLGYSLKSLELYWFIHKEAPKEYDFYLN